MHRVLHARGAGLLLAGLVLFGAGVLVGQKTAPARKPLLHVFAFNEVEGTTPAQLDELWAAPRKMASQIPEIKNIWMGKIIRHNRDWHYGMVFEFDNDAGHKVYEKHPAHDEWVKTYSKVRVEGTNTIDIQGQ